MFSFCLMILSPLLILLEILDANTSSDSFLPTGLWPKFILQRVTYKAICDLSPVSLFIHSQPATLPSISRISALPFFHGDFFKSVCHCSGRPKDTPTPHPLIWLQYLFLANSYLFSKSWFFFLLLSLPTLLAPDPFYKFYLLTVLCIWSPVSVEIIGLLLGLLKTLNSWQLRWCKPIFLLLTFKIVPSHIVDVQ